MTYGLIGHPHHADIHPHLSHHRKGLHGPDNILLISLRSGSISTASRDACREVYLVLVLLKFIGECNAWWVLMAWFRLKFCLQDQQYIESKIEALQQHADAVLDHIYEKAKALQAEGNEDPQVKERQNRAREELRRQLDNLEAVAQNLKKVGEEKRDLTYQEYEVGMVGKKPVVVHDYRK